jgi:hypothetical protein
LSAAADRHADQPNQHYSAWPLSPTQVADQLAQHKFTVLTSVDATLQQSTTK